MLQQKKFLISFQVSGKNPCFSLREFMKFFTHYLWFLSDRKYRATTSPLAFESVNDYEPTKGHTKTNMCFRSAIDDDKDYTLKYNQLLKNI